MVQWLRIHLPMQGTWFDPWSGKIQQAWEHLSPCLSSQRLRPRAAVTETLASRARAPQREKPVQWEALAPQQRVSPT